MTDIREQIERLHDVAYASRNHDGESEALTEAADTMEKMLSDLEEARLVAKMANELTRKVQDRADKMLAVVEVAKYIKFRVHSHAADQQFPAHYELTTEEYITLRKALAALDQEQEPDKCDHDWFTPADNDKVKWGNYQMCRKCHTIAEKET